VGVDGGEKKRTHNGKLMRLYRYYVRAISGQVAVEKQRKDLKEYCRKRFR